MVSEREEAQGKDLRPGKGRGWATIKISKLSDFSSPLPSQPDLNSGKNMLPALKSQGESMCIATVAKVDDRKVFAQSRRRLQGDQTKGCFCQQFTGVGCWSAAAFGRLREGAMHGWSTFAEVLSARRDISRHRSTTVLPMPRHVKYNPYSGVEHTTVSRHRDGWS